MIVGAKHTADIRGTVGKAHIMACIDQDAGGDHLAQKQCLDRLLGGSGVIFKGEDRPGRGPDQADGIRQTCLRDACQRLRLEISAGRPKALDNPLSRSCRSSRSPRRAIVPRHQTCRRRKCPPLIA